MNERFIDTINPIFVYLTAVSDGWWPSVILFIKRNSVFTILNMWKLGFTWMFGIPQSCNNAEIRDMRAYYAEQILIKKYIQYIS